MRRVIIFCALALLWITVETGCTKNDSGSGNALPDVSNFSISTATSVSAGAAAAVSVSAPSLGTGVFTIHFNLSAPNAATDQTATLTMSGATGIFQTPVLASVGSTTLTATSITNSVGNTASITGNNTIVITTTAPHDSTGLMNATINSLPFRATDVTATLSGSSLTISGTVWTPGLSQIVLYNNRYSHNTGTIYFNTADTTTSRGSAHYSATGGVAQVAAYGSITITNTSPLLTGSFSFTNPDSSRVNGTFSTPAP
jgi:hypothetical protein